MSVQERLQMDCLTLREKLSYSEDLNQNQGLLFNLKLKERALLLKEMSNQVNIMSIEIEKRDRIDQIRHARITPGLAVPISEVVHSNSTRGKGDISNNGTNSNIQPIHSSNVPIFLSRRDSSPGLSGIGQVRDNVHRILKYLNLYLFVFYYF